MEWNRSLAYCFVHDTSLPIPVINEKLFNYYIKLYEEEKQSYLKWLELNTLVELRFENNPKLFENYRKDIRDRIINTVTTTEAYKQFNNMDMKPYAVDNSKYKVSKSVYIEPNIDKIFMSIDLKSANFQAMKYINKEIMLGAETYEDFMRKFTDIDYFINQKYIRQVIFGQMNPGRHFTIEKYMVSKIMEYVENLGLNITPSAITSDEVVYEVDKSYYNFIKLSDTLLTLNDDIFKTTGLEVNIELFTLNGYGLYAKSRNKKIFTFYKKQIFDGNYKSKLKGIPEPFYAITWKLINNKKLGEYDYHIAYKIDDVTIDSILQDEFYISEIKN